MPMTDEIHLVRRPDGMPTREDFALVQAPLAEPTEGRVRVGALWLSGDPHMGPRPDADQPLNAPLLGGGIGRVITSLNPKFPDGALVRHGAGFRKRFVSDGKGLALLAPDPELPLSVYLHALGGTGITAYGGLLDIGALKDGEQVFVSTAAGAVGSVAAQIAKIKGCYVVGSTGSAEKAAWLRDELKLDAVINYKAEPIGERLAQVTPKGIDVYFENVGGEHMDAALACARPFARFALCGMISQYNATGDMYGVKNLIMAVGKSLKLEGFIVSNHFQHLPDFLQDMSGWINGGKLKWTETVDEGIENAPGAFLKLFQGGNTGKMLVKLG